MFIRPLSNRLQLRYLSIRAIVPRILYPGSTRTLCAGGPEGIFSRPYSIVNRSGRFEGCRGRHESASDWPANDIELGGLAGGPSKGFCRACQPRLVLQEGIALSLFAAGGLGTVAGDDDSVIGQSE